MAGCILFRGGTGFSSKTPARRLSFPAESISPSPADSPGQTVTYGDLARVLGCASAQAIGGAVGHNPISIMIPCHRVVGADGSLTGYAGGLARKQCLLSLEKADLPSCRAAVLAK